MIEKCLIFSCFIDFKYKVSGWIKIIKHVQPGVDL